MVEKIMFKGREWILVDGGAITTKEDFTHFRPSYAHLFRNGEVKRYNEVIGHESDIKRLGKSDADIESFDGFGDTGWFEKPRKATNTLTNPNTKSGDK